MHGPDDVTMATLRILKRTNPRYQLAVPLELRIWGMYFSDKNISYQRDEFP